MKRKIVKMFNGKKPISLWRITFVKRGMNCHSNFFKLPISGHFVPQKQVNELYYMTYFVFAPDYPTALNKLKFVSKHDWQVYAFERFRELDYNLIYKL